MYLHYQPANLFEISVYFYISGFSALDQQAETAYFWLKLGLYLNHQNLVLKLLYSLQCRIILSTIIHQDRRHET
jgi:hypothetical protein